MPISKEITKVMIIGSGPIVIGQAAEFDYAGTQACKALREEGLEVVLVNSNPATIMTDSHIAHRTYIEPLTLGYLEEVIRRERPQGLIPTLGGQVALNTAVELARSGVLDRYGLRLLGTQISAIEQAEDREKFKRAMEAIGEPVLPSLTVTSVAEAIDWAEERGYPVVVRPGFTLGGTGGGLARTRQELAAIVSRGLKLSPAGRVLVEACVLGWKEVEYEVVRDGADNCITVCNMENIDPMGIHTGDSIVVAPSQTLTNYEYHRLREASLKIIRSLGIEGGCNIQFAVDPSRFRYYVIEVNPRVSRSSALASKASGYPIARVAAKIAVGLTLDEIPNAVTGKTKACHEPALDYVVVKIPRFPFDKFASANRRMDTQMKATGEVMAIGRTLEEALLKALRSLDLGIWGPFGLEERQLSTGQLISRLRHPDDRRLFAITESLRRGLSINEVAELTGIDPLFITKLQNIADLEKEAVTAELHTQSSPAFLLKAKRMGCPDRLLAQWFRTSEQEIRSRRKRLSIVPCYRMVDTCAAEFEAETPYYYSTYGGENEARDDDETPKVLVIGSGPIRIGQGIEFDYCSVHAVWTLKDLGLRAIIVNNNPETVSTDFDTSDRLYFEPLTLEDVLAVVDQEKPRGVLVQFGGQTAINLARPLAEAGVTILGTSVESIDTCEDRNKFERLLSRLNLSRPPGQAATSINEAVRIAARVGYPVVVRPSYVLGGQAMAIVCSEADLQSYAAQAMKISPDYPVLVDKYLPGIELEVDAVSDGEDVLVAGIMQHIERAGVHSGDSIAIYPSPELDPAVKREILCATVKLARELDIKGLINIQFVLFKGKLYILEINPRASRTVPFISKLTGLPLVRLATRVMLGQSLSSQGYGTGIWPEPGFFGAKVPVFSFGKLAGVDIALGPEMKSTGEVMGIGATLHEALYKGFLAAGCSLSPGGTILVSMADRDKRKALPLIRDLARMGFRLCATRGTAQALAEIGIEAETVLKIREGRPNIVDRLHQNDIQLVINTLTRGREPERDGFKIRRTAAEHGIPCLTSLDTAKAFFAALTAEKPGPKRIYPLQDLSLPDTKGQEGK